MLSAVLEKLDSNNMIDLLPEASVEYLRSSIFIEPFAPAPRIIEVKCTTNDPVLSANICNCLIEIGPSEYTKNGGSGELTSLYYAEIPEQPDLE